MKELDAGPELDALIAEKVMGWQWANAVGKSFLLPNGVTERERYHWKPGKDGPPRRIEEFYTQMDYCKIPRYSTDIATAWVVVEKLMPVVGHIYPAHDEETGKLMHWCAVVEKGDSERFGVIASTAPLAICRAALRAVAK